MIPLLPKSQSNFLLLYPLLKPFKDRWEPGATADVPFVLVLLLLLPFYSRNKKHSPLYRPLAVLGVFALVAWFSVYTILGHNSEQGASMAANTAVSSQALASVKTGAELFSSQGCAGCHTIHGHGGSIGPDISDIGSQGHSNQWLTTQIRNPKAHNPSTVMPSFDSLSTAQVSNLVDYLQSLKSSSSRPAQGTAPAQAGGSTNEPNTAAATSTSGPNESSGSAENKSLTSQNASLSSKGKSLFRSEGCIGCHRVDGSGGHIGPNLSNIGSEDLSRQWLTVQIRNPKKHDPEGIMPSFASLSNENLNALVMYLESLEGPSRPTASSQSAGSPVKSAVESQVAPPARQSQYPGRGTYKFISLTIAGFAVAVLIVIGLWIGFTNGSGRDDSARPDNQRRRTSSEEDNSANSFGTYHKKYESDEPSTSSASFALIVIVIVAIITTAVILIFSAFVTTKSVPSVTTRHISSQQASQSGNTSRPVNDQSEENKE
jgi:sulfur oxidation c-type cytochrome SoxX